MNVVTGADDVRAYGDIDLEKSRRYDRTREFLQLVRRLWREEDVTFDGEYFAVEHSTLEPRTFGADEGRHPELYFGGASAAAEEVAAAEADVQLFWGEPLDGIAERIERLNALSEKLDREHAPLEYGLRITTLVRDTSERRGGTRRRRLRNWPVSPQCCCCTTPIQRRVSDG